MDYKPEQRVDVYADALRGLRKLEPDQEKILKYLDFIDMYLALDEKERRVYYLKYPEEAEIMSTFAERYRQEGRQKGRQEGRQEEARDMLLQALEAKFNTVPKSLRDRIQALDDAPKFKILLREAVLSKDLGEFEKKLSQ